MEEKPCPRCFHLTQAHFPAGVVAPAQDGTSIRALATYLVSGQVVPYERASQVLREVFGIQLSAGSIAPFVRACHQQLAGVETDLKTALVKAKVIHQDETGLRGGFEGWWVHVGATDRLTHYATHRSRGRAVLDAIGIAPQFRVTSVHDGLKSYEAYAFTQAWCNVHHVRELTCVEEELKQPWAGQMKDLLLSMKAKVERATSLGLHELDLLVHVDFLHAFAVPNAFNQTERGLRMIPHAAKRSPGVFATPQGVAMFFLPHAQLPVDRTQTRNRTVPCTRAHAFGAPRSSRFYMTLLNGYHLVRIFLPLYVTHMKKRVEQ